MSQAPKTEWKTLESIQHGWTQDNYGLNQTVSLQEDERGHRRLRLYRHDDPTMWILPLISTEGTLHGMEELPHHRYASLMEGNGYGGDILEIAKAAKMEFREADAQEVDYD